MKNKREGLHEQLERINDEISQHETGRKSTQERLEGLLSAKQEMEQHLEKEVMEQLKASFHDKSDSGLQEEILKMKVADPKLEQVSNNIKKFRVKNSFHIKAISDLRRQAGAIKREIQAMDADEALKGCYDLYYQWFESLEKNEAIWQDFKRSVATCHFHGIDYNEALKRLDIDDGMFLMTVQDKLRSGVLGQTIQADLVRSLSRVTLTQPNMWFIEPGKGNERRLGNRREKIDIRRNNFK